MSVFNASSKTNILKTGLKTKYFDNLLAMVEMPPHNKTSLMRNRVELNDKV